MKCIICGNEVNPAEVGELFEELFARANTLGMDSLTEHEQCVVEGLVCAEECYEKLP